jgi:uncharacterized protein (TIGR03435 family)
MDAAEKALKELIDRHLPSPTHMELAVSGDRVLDDLRSNPPHLQKARVQDLPRVVPVWRPMMSAAAAAVLLAAVIGTAILWPRGARVYAAGANGLQFTLADDSRVEMRAYSELTVDRAIDGIRIDLKKGGIIVNAAKQRRGHLYVQTREMTVAVVGTTFVVNAADDGSRVSVIEGEVRVREGALEQRLRPGEQVSTSPVLAARPIREEIAWSRHAGVHLAILESFTKGISQTAGPLTPLARQANVAGAQTPAAQAELEFEEASVRPCDPDNVPPLPQGARGGGANSFYMTPGRTYALCVTPATLIRTAYGYGPAALNPGGRGFGPGGGGLTLNAVFGLGTEDGLRVRGGPEWVRSERYTIEAVAGGLAEADTMRGAMLLALLESRFKLKAHIETEQIPAFALTVAPGGLKIKPVQASGISPDGFIATTVTSDACEPGPPMDVPAIRIPRSFAEVRGGAKPSCGMTASLNGPNFVMVGGAAGMPALARLLRGRLGNVPVMDKTGSTELFNFILEFVIDENTPGQVFATQKAEDPASVPRGQTIFAALEQQLGLRLEPARAPREFIVIDHVERPAAN